VENYEVVNGTSYNEGTPEKVIQVLEKVKYDGTRIKLDYGKDGKSWGDCYDVTGTLGRSTGTVKIPLLIHNSKSTGGTGILTDCIIQIKESRGGRVLYQCDNYQPFNR